MGGALLSHGLDWLTLLAGRVVCPTPETALDATGVPFRAGVVNSLLEHGRCCMVGLETGRTIRGELRSDSIRCSTDSQWSMVLDILRHAEAGFGVYRDSGVMVVDTGNYVGLLASERHRRHALHTVPYLGIIRRNPELLYLAVESERLMLIASSKAIDAAYLVVTGIGRRFCKWASITAEHSIVRSIHKAQISALLWNAACQALGEPISHDSTAKITGVSIAIVSWD